LQHPGEIHHAEFSADGRRIVTSWGTITPRYQGQARVWDAKSGKSVGVLEHPYPVFHATFRADGRRIATASGIPNRILGMARVYDVPFWNRFNALEQQAAHQAMFSLKAAGCSRSARTW
jgi:WD40 repeat protein